MELRPFAGNGIPTLVAGAAVTRRPRARGQSPKHENAGRGPAFDTLRDPLAWPAGRPGARSARRHGGDGDVAAAQTDIVEFTVRQTGKCSRAG